MPVKAGTGLGTKCHVTLVRVRSFRRDLLATGPREEKLYILTLLCLLCFAPRRVEVAPAEVRRGLCQDQFGPSPTSALTSAAELWLTVPIAPSTEAVIAPD